MEKTIPETWMLASFCAISAAFAYGAYIRAQYAEARKSDGHPFGVTPLSAIADIFIISMTALVFAFPKSDAGFDAGFCSAAFGAFFAASAISDAKTGWVPDTLIVPAWMFGGVAVLSSWTVPLSPYQMMGTFVLMIIVFYAMVLAYLRFTFIKITPPDLSFAIFLIAIPLGLTQLISEFVALILSILMVKMRPEIIRGLISSGDQEKLTRNMEIAHEMEDGEMSSRGWFPLGPVALFCAIVAAVANAVVAP